MRELADAQRITRFMQVLGRERAHQRDLEDVAAMLDRGLIDREQALEYFDQIEPELYRFPAIDPASFRRRVEETLRR